MIQCQNIVYVLNQHGHEIVQPKLRVLNELTNRTENDIKYSQSDIVEELINVQTDAIMLTEGACKSGQSDQDQNENMTQTEVQIESGPQSLRKIKCTHCKKLYLHVKELQKNIVIIDVYMTCIFYVNCYICKS